MIKPLISVHLVNRPPAYHAQDVLRVEYQIDAVEAEEIQAVEVSVLWYTEGKGDEDIGVHYFQRQTATDPGAEDLRTLRQFECVLPNSPLSYHGQILSIRWCVRVRVFLRKGREAIGQYEFQLESPQLQPLVSGPLRNA